MWGIITVDLLFKALIIFVLAWIILIMLTGKKRSSFIGAILLSLLFIITPYVTSIQCEDCGNRVVYGDTYCTTCGHYQNNRDIFGNIKCESCDKRTPSDSTVCKYCGSTIN